jgi:hypothetical protein
VGLGHLGSPRRLPELVFQALLLIKRIICVA